MAKKPSDLETDVPKLAQAARTVIDSGRAAANQLPSAFDGARDMVGSASAAIDDFSDLGVVAATAMSAGVTLGLFLAGAPRLILALACLPMIITARSALQRGVGPAQLVAPRG